MADRVQYDFGDQELVATITGTSLVGKAAKFAMRTPSNRRKYWTCTVDEGLGRVSYEYQRNDIDEGGDWGVRVIISNPDGSDEVSTEPEATLSVSWR